MEWQRRHEIVTSRKPAFITSGALGETCLTYLYFRIFFFLLSAFEAAHKELMYTLYCIENSAENFDNIEGAYEVLKVQKLDSLFFKITVEVQSHILFPMGKDSS